MKETNESTQNKARNRTWNRILMTSSGETTVLDTPPATAPATASTVALCFTRCCRCSCACSCSPRDFCNSITSSPFWLPDDPSRDRSCILLLLPLYLPWARSISFAMQQRARAQWFGQTSRRPQPCVLSAAKGRGKQVLFTLEGVTTHNRGDNPDSAIAICLECSEEG